ncbi:MAG: hypothetical protein MH252_09575 [Thermosynechococcaceae cyanobacterium MS004]|nr:hypothetical protein [Thermosynechococcaceae cyanobacterium MS004]
MSIIKISELNEVALYDVNAEQVFGGVGFSQTATIGLTGGTYAGGAGGALSLSASSLVLGSFSLNI